MIQFGEVVYGGVGSGLYGMLVFVIIAMFIAGLMVGRTPEHLGKKIEPREMKIVTIIILIPIVLILALTAIAVLSDVGKSAILNPGPTAFRKSSMRSPQPPRTTAVLLPVFRRKQPVLQSHDRDHDGHRPLPAWPSSPSHLPGLLP